MILQAQESKTYPSRQEHTALVEEFAVIKNRTVQELIEDYILAGLHSDIQNHQALGMQYANYLMEKHQYDSLGRWKV